MRRATGPPASTAERDQAQSPRYVTAAAATTHPPKKPTRGCSEAFDRAVWPTVNRGVREVVSRKDSTAFVKLPVMTAVDGATGKPKRKSANWHAQPGAAIITAMRAI